MAERETQSKSSIHKKFLLSTSVDTPLTAIQHIPFTHATFALLSLSRSFSFSNAKHARRRQSTIQNYPSPPSPCSFLVDLQFFHHHPPQRWLKNSPFPNPTSALSRLSYTPEFSCRHQRRSGISMVCLSQPDSQFLYWPSSHETQTSDSDR